MNSTGSWIFWLLVIWFMLGWLLPGCAGKCQVGCDDGCQQAAENRCIDDEICPRGITLVYCTGE